MSNKKVSVVIPTYNRAWLLERTLPSYLVQAEIGEVIVVDDASQDNTPAVLKRWCLKDNRFIIISQNKNRGIAHALNIGFERAAGDYIYKGEDDIELTDNFFAVLIGHLEGNKADIIAARRVCIQQGEDRDSALERADNKRGPFIKRSVQQIGDAELKGNEDLEFPILTDQILIRRNVFEKVKFDESFQGYPYRMEADFTFKAKQLGYKLIYCPHAVCFHVYSPSFVRGRIRSLWTENKWILKNHYYFLKKHRRYLAPLLNFNGGPHRLIFEFLVLRIYGQIRSALYRIKLFAAKNRHG